MEEVIFKVVWFGWSVVALKSTYELDVGSSVEL